MTTLSMPQPAGLRRQLRGLLPGWAISLVLHAAALALLVHAVPARQHDDGPERRSTLVMVRLAPPPRPAQKPVEPAAPPVPRAAARAAPSAPAAPSRPHPARATIQAAVPAPLAAGPTPEPAPAAPSAEPSGTAPALDIAAARSAARAFARSEPAPAPRSGTLLKAIQNETETQNEKLGRDIERARRGDCQTKYAGMGLLAVIPLVANTVTGTGCKWK
jgi:hypothetical protein